MAAHRAFQVPSANADFELVDIETTSPSRGHIRIDVAACLVCGTDRAFVSGASLGLSWPVTPGHEIAGTVAEIGAGVGAGVERVGVGDRVAVGWFGGSCGHCTQCLLGDFIRCEL